MRRLTLRRQHVALLKLENLHVNKGSENFSLGLIRLTEAPLFTPVAAIMEEKTACFFLVHRQIRASHL